MLFVGCFLVLWFCCLFLVVWATTRTKEKTTPKTTKLFLRVLVVCWFGVVVCFGVFFVLFDFFFVLILVGFLIFVVVLIVVVLIVVVFVVVLVVVVVVIVVVVVVCHFVVLLFCCFVLFGVHRPKKHNMKNNKPLVL